MKRLLGLSLVFVLIGCGTTPLTQGLKMQPASESRRPLVDLLNRSSFSREIAKRCEFQHDLVGCTTDLIPGAETVKVTRTQALVADCKSLGPVEAEPPYATPKDATNEMRNKSALAGGNVLLVGNLRAKATGVTYSCQPAVAAAIP
jgi:hypothetical protein